MRKLELHWQIMIGMVAGILAGLLFSNLGMKEFVNDWIAPLGTIFIKLLKLIAVPLIIASLIKGISDLKDISKFRRMGSRTIVIYMITTTLAISIGLLLANIMQPGEGITEATIEKLTSTYSQNAKVVTHLDNAAKQANAGPLQFVVDMVPDNAVAAMSNNKLMLQVIFFTILFGICMLLIPPKDSAPLKAFFDSLNEVVLKMIDLIMLIAPYAVFALLCKVVISSDDPDILMALVKYAMVVVLGLISMIGVYCLIIAFYVKKNPFWFLKQLSPAQLLAFSTSSSAATLPVTMERVEEHLGVDKEVSSFVLPVGATVNMDGTSLYQAVAAVFIMQVLWPEGLTFGNQMTIVITALLASIGTAAVPGAGMVMLVIVLEAVGFPADKLPIALALIFAVDRPLDMLRTVINITGDATVSMAVGKSLNLLHEPHPKELSDYTENL